MTIKKIVISIRCGRILEDTDVMEIKEKFSLVPRKTIHGKWVWMEKYYKVCRPNDNLIYSKEEYLVEKIKGLTVTV